jgi:hypothetical protein
MIKQVEVIQEFPGYKVGDQLELNPLGNYDFVGNAADSDRDAFSIIESVLVSNKPVLSKKEVMQHMGSYFKDTTNYSIRSKEDINKRISELTHWLNEYKEDGVALTVWQNLIWELEWVLGKRQIGETK